MSTRYFRAGVGIVLYTETREVFLFKRNQPPVGLWQFPQGGIDTSESPDTALWRELQEEVGLTAEDILQVTPVPGWHAYQDLHTITNHTSDRIGQIHRWFFLKLKDGVTINLKNATDDEFSEYEITSFTEAIKRANDHKSPIYQMLEQYFKTEIA